jgi:hypothetical protein
MASSKSWKLPMFWKYFMVAWVVMLVAIAGMNFFVDPLDLYGFNFLPPIEFNRYDKKTELLASLKEQPQALILGSSRSEPLDPELVEDLTGLRCFNMAQPSARIETIIAALKIAVEDMHAPIEIVIVEADPQYFHPSLWISPQARFALEYVKYLDSDSAIPILEERITRLLTVEQTISSMVSIRRALFPNNKPARLVYSSDGMAMYPEYYAQIKNGTYDLKKVLDQRVPMYPESSLGLSTFMELSEARKAKWMEFLSYCEANHIKPLVFMPPVHPQLWNLIVKLKADRLYSETDAFLKQSLESVGGEYRNYTQVESFGGSPVYFRDEVHLSQENCDLLLENLLGD